MKIKITKMRITVNKKLFIKRFIPYWVIVLIFSIVLLFKGYSNDLKPQFRYVKPMHKHFSSSQNYSFQESDAVYDSMLRYNITSFPYQELPIEIKGCDYEENCSEDEYLHRDGSIYVPYCRFNIHQNIKALIYLGIADCYIPVVVTYSNDSIIDEKALNIGFGDIYCGETTEDFLRIDTNYNIYVSDTITKYLCETPDVVQTKYVLYKVGTIFMDGKITISDTMLKIIN